MLFTSFYHLCCSASVIGIPDVWAIEFPQQQQKQHVSTRLRTADPFAPHTRQA